jgi:hypothetical protein
MVVTIAGKPERFAVREWHLHSAVAFGGGNKGESIQVTLT